MVVEGLEIHMKYCLTTEEEINLEKKNICEKKKKIYQASMAKKVVI